MLGHRAGKVTLWLGGCCIRKVARLPRLSHPVSGGYWAASMADSGAAPGGPEKAQSIKSAKELKKEAKKNAKLAKFQEKTAKQQQAQGSEEVNVCSSRSRC